MNAGLAEELSTLAHRNGAAGFGVTGVEVFARERAALRASREAGRSGPLRFTYDDPDLATDVSRSFPWAKSLVVVSYDYLPQADTPSQEGAVVGRFATTNQYEGVRRITGEIAGCLQSRGYRAEILSDDNRLVDRAAAVRAGVGWLGKSTMVLAPGHGPWMLLGTVVTDARSLQAALCSGTAGPVRRASRPVQLVRWGSGASTRAVVCRPGCRPRVRCRIGSDHSWEGGSTGATIA